MPLNANAVWLNVLKGAEGQMPVFTDFRTTPVSVNWPTAVGGDSHGQSPQLMKE